jgi:hypothetical protein
MRLLQWAALRRDREQNDLEADFYTYKKDGMQWILQ